MKTSSLLIRSFCAVTGLFFFGSMAISHAGSENLIVNGNFEVPPPVEGGVPNWHVLGDQTRATVVSEDGKRFLRLNLPGRDYLQAWQAFPVGKNWTGLEVSAKVRITNLTKGPEGYNTATLLYYFENGRGKQVGAWNQHMFMADQDWTSFEDTLNEIPKDAKTLRVACSIMNASGTADFDDVVVKPILGSDK